MNFYVLMKNKIIQRENKQDLANCALLSLWEAVQWPLLLLTRHFYLALRAWHGHLWGKETSMQYYSWLVQFFVVMYIR